MKKYLKYLPLLLPLHAFGDSLYLGAWSEHLFSGDNLNEQHDLIAYERNDIVVGRFINSYDRETFLVGKKFHWEYKDIEAGYFLALTHGYTVCFGDDDSNANFCPIAAPYISFDMGVRPTALLLGEALTLSFRFDF